MARGLESAGKDTRSVQVELVFVTANGRVRPRELKPGRYLIGRDTRCAMRVTSAEVSRRHCEITVDESEVTIRDLDSSNGTWVNAERVDRAELGAGDLISVGPVVLVVRIDGSPDVIDPVLLYEQGRPTAEPSSPREVRQAEAQPKTLLRDAGLGVPTDPDSSSIVEFDFAQDDDLDDQPPL